jgi:hypothetical protein
MTRYRLYTERFDNIAAIARQRFEGFTLINAVGYWQGASEDSVIVEVVTDDASRIKALAEDIRRTNHQQAVMVTSEPVTVEWALAPTDSVGPLTTGPLGDEPMYTDGWRSEDKPRRNLHSHTR